MKKLLAICIPTYKRPLTLQRCISSVATQIEKFSLFDSVLIYVANDASPDNTDEIISGFVGKPYFYHVSRPENLGMNQNIKGMLIEASAFSEYQLIITDDDYLQPDLLDEIVNFLRARLQDDEKLPAIWTPRYSYTEDQNLHKIVCNPFSRNVVLQPSVYNAGKYMGNGFILSGLLLRAQLIDYDFWEDYGENAYFPILFFGDLILRHGAYYWHRNIVHHTVLNDCHWERWGKNDAVIEFRLFSDYANAYSVMRKHMKTTFASLKFYLASFPSIYRLITGRLNPENLCRNRSEIYAAAEELRRDGFMAFDSRLKLSIFCAFVFSALMSLAKIAITRVNILFTRQPEKRSHYRKRIDKNLGMLSAIPVLARAVL